MKNAVSLILSGSWIIISVMVQLNPTDTIPMHGSPLAAAGLQIFGAVTIFLIFGVTFRASSRNSFFRLFTASLILSFVFSTLAGELIHRDYYSYYMPIFLAHAILFLQKLLQLGLVRNRLHTYRYLFYAAIFMSSLVFGWLILVSYTIVVRLEPRWIEATWYNIINAAFGFLLLWSAATLWEHRKKTVQVKGGRVLIDEIDYTGSLSPQEVVLLTVFLTSDSAPLNCSALLFHLRQDTESLPQAVTRGECNACIEQNFPPSKCASYRNLKNRVSDIKKYLELMRIGTILPTSQNLREIKDAGWIFRFFDDVRLED